MATGTQTKSTSTRTETPNGTARVDAALEQVRDLNEQFLASARKVGNVYVDLYEQTVDRVIDGELKFAGLSRQKWLEGLIEAQADFTRELADTYASAARSLLK
jgi:hypothetical protein